MRVFIARPGIGSSSTIRHFMHTDISNHSVRDVFTPTKPARIAFVEREEVNDKLVNALRTPGKQLVVYGHSGTGKTTLLLNKLQQLYEHHITTRCMKGLKFEQLLLDAFDQLEPYYISDLSIAEKRVPRLTSLLVTKFLVQKFEHVLLGVPSGRRS